MRPSSSVSVCEVLVWGHRMSHVGHMYTQTLTITIGSKFVCACKHKRYFSVPVQVGIMNLQRDHILTCHILSIPHASVWDINKLGNIVVDVSQADSDLKMGQIDG